MFFFRYCTHSPCTNRTMIGVMEYFLFQTVQEGQKTKKYMILEYDLCISFLYYPRNLKQLLLKKYFFFVSKVKNKFLLLPKKCLVLLIINSYYNTGSLIFFSNSYILLRGITDWTICFQF